MPNTSLSAPNTAMLPQSSGQQQHPPIRSRTYSATLSLSSRPTISVSGNRGDSLYRQHSQLLHVMGDCTCPDQSPSCGALDEQAAKPTADVCELHHWLLLAVAAAPAARALHNGRAPLREMHTPARARR